MTDWHNPDDRESAMAAKWAEAEGKVKVLREALEYAVKQVPELATVPGIRAALEATK